MVDWEYLISGGVDGFDIRGGDSLLIPAYRLLLAAVVMFIRLPAVGVFLFVLRRLGVYTNAGVIFQAPLLCRVLLHSALPHTTGTEQLEVLFKVVSVSMSQVL